MVRENGFLRAAAATPEIRVADPAFNIEAIYAQQQEAEKAGAALLVFPELAVTAYTCGELFHQRTLMAAAKAALDSLLMRTRESRMLIVLGFPLEYCGKLYNTAAVLQRGRVLAFIPKRHLPNYTEFYEARWFMPGEERVRMLSYDNAVSGESYSVPFGMNILISATDQPDFVLGCELCEDAWVALPPATRHAMAGATVIANCSASDEIVGKDSYRRALISQASARLTAAYIYANAGEGESSQDLIFGGQNLICENGTVLAESERFKTGIQYADVDLQRLSQERLRLSTCDVRERGEYTYLTVRLGESAATSAAPGGTTEQKEKLAELQHRAEKLRRFVDPHPFVPGNPLERAKRCEEILTMQAMGLKKRLQHIGCRTAVIGISGGLDSTLALLVTARAFDLLGIPRENILSVTMPAFGTTDRTYNNAVLLTRRLGASLREINIKAAVLQHFQDLGHDPENHNVTYENSQARERTQLLMDLANEAGGIVIGTGDLSELALGWATYNGDHMSMYAVNVGVPKSLVRHLVQYAADTAEDSALASVLRDVLATPVSPELLPPTAGGKISQKTEDLVGPYELHDFFLYQILRFGFSPRRVLLLALRAFSAENLRLGRVEPQQDESLNVHLYDAETILKWLRKFYWRFFSQQFKRSCLPDGPKVGSVAVSPRGDLRMPSDAAVNAWIRELKAL